MHEDPQYKTVVNISKKAQSCAQNKGFKESEVSDTRSRQGFCERIVIIKNLSEMMKAANKKYLSARALSGPTMRVPKEDASGEEEEVWIFEDQPGAHRRYHDRQGWSADLRTQRLAPQSHVWPDQAGCIHDKVKGRLLSQSIGDKPFRKMFLPSLDEWLSKQGILDPPGTGEGELNGEAGLPCARAVNGREPIPEAQHGHDHDLVNVDSDEDVLDRAGVASTVQWPTQVGSSVKRRRGIEKPKWPKRSLRPRLEMSSPSPSKSDDLGPEDSISVAAEEPGSNPMYIDGLTNSFIHWIPRTDSG